MTQRDQTAIIEHIRQGLARIVESIPHTGGEGMSTADVLSTRVAGSARLAQERRVVARRAQRAYRPRVVYGVKKAAPKRHPLPETETLVYRAVKRAPSKATAKWLKETLNLRDGQLWGALKRLIDAGILAAKPAR